MAKTTTKVRAKPTTKSATKPATKTMMKSTKKPTAKAVTKSTRRPAAKAVTKPTKKPAAKAATKAAISTETSTSNTTAASFAGVSKFLKQFKLPGVDINALIATQRKDIEALVAANKQVYEGVQSLAKRQTEILRETLEAWQAAAKELAGKSLSEGIEIRTELAKRAFVKALGNMRELAEMSTKSQTEVLEGIKNRAQENLAELRKLLQSE